MFYLQINAFQHTIRIIVLPSFSRHKLKPLSKCCVFKVRQYIKYKGKHKRSYFQPNLDHSHSIKRFRVIWSKIINMAFSDIDISFLYQCYIHLTKTSRLNFENTI